MNAISQPETNKYLIQTRSQTKSGGIKVPEIHGTNKGLDPHVKLGRQRSLPTLPMHSILPTSLTQPIDKGLPTYPTPKPRIGQGKAGLKRKIRTNQTVPLPRQTIAQPIQTPALKEMQSLPEPIVQSQEKVQPQYHIWIQLPQHQPVDPTCIIQPIGPKIQNRPSPPYHDLYARPPPRPPDITNLINSQKDILDTDLRQECRYRGKYTIPGRYNFRDLWKTRHILCTRTIWTERPDRYLQTSTKIST